MSTWNNLVSFSQRLLYRCSHCWLWWLCAWVCAVRNAVWWVRRRNVLIPADSLISHVSSSGQSIDLYHPKILHYCPSYSAKEECQIKTWYSWKSCSEWLWKPLRPIQQQEFLETALVWHLLHRFVLAISAPCITVAVSVWHSQWKCKFANLLSSLFPNTFKLFPFGMFFKAGVPKIGSFTSNYGTELIKLLL